MAALVILTGLSIAWSVSPADSWIETNRTLTYAVVFAAGVALVRVAGDRWAVLLGATVVAAAVICGYALLTKVFPGLAQPGRDLRPPARAVRLLERGRASPGRSGCRAACGSARGAPGTQRSTRSPTRSSASCS